MTLAFAVPSWLVNLAYVGAAVCFVLGMRGLSSPRSARRGNVVAAAGMLVAVAFTLTLREVDDYLFVLAAVAVGVVIGVPAARYVRMTAMPQMVALLNGLGGGAAALVAAAEFHRITATGSPETDTLVPTLASALLGPLTFSGSVLAFAKLQELLPGRPLVFGGQQAVNALVFTGALGCAGATAATEDEVWLVACLALSLVFGLLLVLPIGGADMPVVIALLNAFSGLGGVATGFVLDNNALIIGGTLVGASGTLLTILMGRAMNRSLANVLFGAFGAAAPGAAAAPAGATDGQMVREITADDAAVMLAYANQVMVVPGYGLAVAQAQHATRELADLLEARGVSVKYAIHPVAGRMPGHMNVLLAEANVPYPQLLDMESANPELARTDVALVVGANDVTNPAARSNPESPLYGMPILDVDTAQNVVVL
ncbi:MAG: NAD(P)(+) transhydrogenase (Re/Si-specific) subunit beta, partial [Thermoleophilia bacterium]|nr:NAD(P)(+) transhydrogenase (Re/Si-specific) subunit beta [Thermoleophilia bacterium]